MSFGKTAVIVTGVCPGEKRIVAIVFSGFVSCVYHTAVYNHLGTGRSITVYSEIARSGIPAEINGCIPVTEVYVASACIICI